jgi:hypothetical protein
MVKTYPIPKPEEGESVHLSLIRRPKSFGLWWSIRDRDGFVDGGCVSTHRTKEAAQRKARVVADWVEARDHA